MVAQEFRELSARRAARARDLARRFPASREVLSFYAAIAEFQEAVVARAREPEALLDSRQRLIELVRDRGPERLREAALALDATACRRAIEDYRGRRDTESPSSFFARVLLQPWAATAKLPPAAGERADCPRCRHRAQAGVLRPRGDGSALTLACSLCLAEWSFPRGRCVSCGEESAAKLAHYGAPEFDYLRVQACDTCKRYLHTVDLAREPAAIPVVDELAALPLDVWARERGYRKLQPNLAGI